MSDGSKLPHPWDPDLPIHRDGIEVGPSRAADLARLESVPGIGVFETIRVVQGEPRHLVEHLKRARDGAGHLGFRIPSLATIAAALERYRSGIELSEYVMRMVFLAEPPGTGRGGSIPRQDGDGTLWITARRMPRGDGGAVDLWPTPAGQARNWVHPSPQVKSTARSALQTWRFRALGEGAFDALLVGPGDELHETSLANLVFRRNGRNLTPPLGPAGEPGPLAGTARGRLVAAGVLGTDSLLRKDLVTTEALWILNAIRGFVPVRRILGLWDPPGEPDPALSAPLESAWNRISRRDPGTSGS